MVPVRRVGGAGGIVFCDERIRLILTDERVVSRIARDGVKEGGGGISGVVLVAVSDESKVDDEEAEEEDPWATGSVR